jgi:hypothetical protein
MIAIRNLSTFPHRYNKDGSWDSICPQCFLTVATRSTEDELRKDEREHQCYKAALEKIAALDRMMEYS